MSSKFGIVREQVDTRCMQSSMAAAAITDSNVTTIPCPDRASPPQSLSNEYYSTMLVVLRIKMLSYTEFRHTLRFFLQTLYGESFFGYHLMDPRRP